MTTPWVQTYSGQIFDLMEMTPDAVRLEDICHHLSNLCRFNGATKFYYSVAEHSVYVHNVVRARTDDETVLRQALLHDAAEAYVGDVLAPIRRLYGLQGFNRLHDRVWKVITEVFDVPEELDQLVKDADFAVLSAEARQIMQWPPPQSWGPLPEPAAVDIRGLGPREARQAFKRNLEQYFSLESYF
jgi:hypothetical protein